MVMNSIYEYRLAYIDGDREVTHIFPADIDGDELRKNLRHFLLATSWSPESIYGILGGEENE